MTERYSGGSNDYYMVYVKNPTTLDSPYWVECNDIIEGLDLTYAEANVLKAIWRIAQWRNGMQEKALPTYDAEKVEFFAKRVMIYAKDMEGE